MAAIPSSHSSVTATDGPVLTLLNKRIRALRKKLNRISQMEESLSRGKSLNKEQEEALRSKSFIVPLIDELERFRRPLLQAVDQEIQIALEKSDHVSETQSEDKKAQEKSVERSESDESGVVSSAVADLLKLVYFGSMFDVRTLSMAHDNFMRRTHERNCCLSYDYVTDDDAAGDPLNDFDLDLVALLGGLLTSRPPHSHLSHKDTLKMCVERANLWLSNSNQPIQPNSSVTYTGLREKLNKIMASDYFTTTPQIIAPIQVAAAVGNFTSFQGLLHRSIIPHVGVIGPVESSAAGSEQEVMQRGRWF
ncbi:uncharacterized protein LOC121798138 [Salvia splendens]|uniref:uncharacterized protein LOC121798138 n=1 Tax=Salvia splendens TaxID=180675 RepID=UPI001C280AE7|nr:uncharacterized protein LOC121798138 [Salvia splendens]XP_042052923.1 uncharacterized protein LOC121798138 [Salvia splendens]XP_042052924.1 uncharacterized protein LOC121798138 [Salvia splendens]XP_042052925.1 uncharacterized protein LOC121798138 [Salvia splendens]XP_042052926.1 uncharacterized protein LOC121798138 [Salvia splendens]XP_042052927.1 uncharacterized protein LOC121798138 [Salvia splendens]XP_042052928.1 uncharacterized protein LOC121798138 [Salvia splendens]XP_042052929.1 unc